MHRPFAIVGSVLLSGAVLAADPEESAHTHFLLPGLRGRDLNATDWSRTLHDNLATGFSPLICQLSRAPIVRNTIGIGGHAAWASVHSRSDGSSVVLAYDGELHCFAANGNRLWRSPHGGSIVHFGNLVKMGILERSNQQATLDATDVVLLASGASLVLLDAVTGETRWSHTFQPPHVQVQAVMADILADHPGLELAVVLAYGDEGALLNFSTTGDPKILWQRPFVVEGEFTERHDHHCDLQLDLSDPLRPMIWNVRRFRCNGVDARTGELVSTLAYDVGGAHRRNYGPWRIGSGAEGRRMVGVAAEAVQVHVHGIHLNAAGPSQVAWEHFYGEVYKGAPGVALASLGMDDMDGDQQMDMLYTVRDPQQALRSFVRLRSVDTGRVEWELADHWGLAVAVQRDGRAGTLVLSCPDPSSRMSQFGDLVVHRVSADGPPHKIHEFHAAEWVDLPAPSVLSHDYFCVRTTDERKQRVLEKWQLHDNRMEKVGDCREPCMVEGKFHGALLSAEGDPTYLLTRSDGQLTACTWSGRTMWSHAMRGGALPRLAATDTDSDGRAELRVITPQRTLQVFDVLAAEKVHQRAEYEHRARWETHSPLAYDLEGSGHPCLILPIAGPDGRLLVRAVRHDGSVAWDSPALDLQANCLDSFVAHAGRFLPGGRPAVAISVGDDRRTREGTYLLDGSNGHIHWFKGLYHRGEIVMPYRAHGVPTAADVDDDGLEEIGIDMLSYMAYLNGEDGSFSLLHHTKNIATENATFTGQLYNTFLPVRHPADPNDRRWFVKGGHGPFGLMNADIVTGNWRADHDYDHPSNIGMVDVDGDGELEVGYSVINSREFICRNAWTGEVEWTVPLPYAPNAPCMSADVDGDRKGDFLIGAFCLGVDAQLQGEIKWQSPVPLEWAIVADFDGDGFGEIACPAQGKVLILGPKP